MSEHTRRREAKQLAMLMAAKRDMAIHDHAVLLDQVHDAHTEVETNVSRVAASRSVWQEQLAARRPDPLLIYASAHAAHRDLERASASEADLAAREREAEASRLGLADALGRATASKALMKTLRRRFERRVAEHAVAALEDRLYAGRDSS